MSPGEYGLVTGVQDIGQTGLVSTIMDLMPEFPATLRMDQEGIEPLRVVATVDGERISLRAGSADLGSWPLGNVEFTPAGPGFDVVIEGERARLIPDDPAAFAATLPEPAPPRQRRSRGVPRHVREVTARPRVLLATGAVAILLAMVILVPVAVGTILLLAGGAALIGSIVYGADPIRASRLPGRLRPSGIAVLGGLGVVAGLVLVFVR